MKKWNFYTEAIKLRLKELIPQNSNESLTRFSQACLYSLLAPSKRIRSLIALLVTELLCGDFTKALDAACALEMIHTYSLIHDDLPSMDDDNMRRGKPSLHCAYDESTAILAGDYLLTRAFEVIANCSTVSDSIKIKLIKSLSHRAGYDGMVGGQVIDIASENSIIDLETVEKLHSLKTGALLIQAIEIATIVSQVDNNIANKFKNFAEKIGLAFQVVDDILDATSSSEQLGKPAGSDLANKKSTYVSILGLNESQKYAEKLISEAFFILEQIPYDTSSLKEISQYILNRKN